MRVVNDSQTTGASSSERERTERRVADPAFADALRRADRRRADPEKTRRSDHRSPERPEPEEEECCPVCGPMGNFEDDFPLVEQEGFALGARPLGPAEARALQALMTQMNPQGALDVLPPAPTVMAPTETAGLLADAILWAQGHLDRYRRFDLEVQHPIHGLLRLRGSFKGGRLQVTYQAQEKAQAHLRKSREPLEQALSELGYDLVSFLPESPQRR